MVKIRYIGDVSPCRIKVFSMAFNDLKTGDVLDLDERHAKKLTENRNFKRIRETFTKPLKVIKPKEEEVEEEKKEEKTLKIEEDNERNKDDSSLEE